MKSNYPLTFLLGFVAFSMNPGFGCSSSDPDDDFQFGESEMSATVSGTWRLTIARAAGDGVISFTLAPGPSASPFGGASDRGPLCVSREFTRPAGACSPQSTLTVAGSIVSAEPSVDATSVSGSFRVSGVTYRGGGLHIKFGPSLTMDAWLEANGAVMSTTAIENRMQLSATLERTP